MKLVDVRVFGGWFRVDIKSFKISLPNIIKKRSWMFKEHLMTYVTDRLSDRTSFHLSSRIQCVLLPSVCCQEGLGSTAE